LFTPESTIRVNKFGVDGEGAGRLGQAERW
jgi:hypothetical protein